MTHITIDPKATDTCGMMVTTVASKRKRVQAQRKAMEITIEGQMLTTITSTLQIPEPATTMVKNDHNDYDRSDDDGDTYIEDEASFKKIVHDFTQEYYDYDGDDRHCIYCDEDLPVNDCTRKGRKVDHKNESSQNDFTNCCKSFSSNVRENDYKRGQDSYRNNRKGGYCNSRVVANADNTYDQDEESYYDVDDASEDDINDNFDNSGEEYYTDEDLELSCYRQASCDDD
ncbi:hypothetical protein DPMN_142016 [Dreissena polymorpha]|uniref:Uncharacterized protein n=1 Tax=Dreissena polymorpha TaxID=45954 RepID=A0A9D4GEM0_DREPO|nr:hypothetical protein DPMN_142016 [Dreissena polymorpha]